MLRKIIKNLFARKGYEIYRKNFYDFNDLKVLTHVFPRDMEILIIDAGANIGQTVSRFKKHWPNSIIYSFEPDPDVFLELKNSSESLINVFPYNLGLGDAVTSRAFHKMQDSGSSSFIRVNKESNTYRTMQSADNIRYHNQTALKNADDKIINCDITTLDVFCKENNLNKINLLKMDVQGYEPQILMGARKLLEDNAIDVILTEIMFTDYYSKRGSFLEIEENISQYGYVLYDIPYLARVPNDNRQRIFFVDAIYIQESMLNG